ncbi:MAG: SDR family NAD(P)-dependent oxidoreductase, partial [Anaerolineae bacterium]|nr:SDR family NAD(P)-dependent oxidoreductase [Anaerolineae bacterium]
EIMIPVGKARTSFLDVRDIGAVAAKVLSEPGHENRAYQLTGGEALDYYQVAELFSQEL